MKEQPHILLQITNADVCVSQGGVMMSGKTKILVFHMKELIYTALFIALAVVLICLLILMFGTGREQEAEQTSSYRAGVYTSAIEFQGQTLSVQVTVDEDHINDVSFVSLDESVATMYPLMESAMDSIGAQICETQSLEKVTYSVDNQYTTELLLGAVADALEKAKQ